ncbi:hypothetical protein LTS15_006264 [Exophiala xenobiotica]|nr:hypothetical protein LTS15_006264 [Exophiala xenobiotica]
MDSSTNHSLNGTQHGNNPSYSFLDGIQSFANDEFSQYFDPALFENTTIGPGFSQQPQTQSLPQQTFNQNVPRQSHSPLPQYNSPQQPTLSHGQYSQPMYDTHQLPQHNYDSRFYPRPSASPAGFDGGYGYQSQMNYNNQGFNAQHINMPQRQTPTPTTNYPPGQQRVSPYINIQARPTQMSHMQNADPMHFGNYQDQNHQSSNGFVDPAMLTANQIMGANSNNTNFPPPQSYLQPSYFKSGSTVDPRSLQGARPVQPTPPMASQQSHIIIPKFEKASKPNTSNDPHVTKKSKKKDGLSGSTEAGSDSEDELSIQEEEPPELTPAFLTLAAPTEEGQRAQYHAVQAVWSPRNKPASAEKVRSGIAGYGDAVRALRDAWKVKNDNLKKAELPNSPTAKDADALKKEVARYRQLMEEVMTRSLKYGHLSVVKRLGENHFTMSALYSFMLDRFTAGDYDSPLVLAILKFVVKFETLDSEMLEMTKLSKILQRLNKKASTEVKALAQTVLDNAVAASAKKKTAGIKAENAASPQVGGSPAESARKELVAGMKRAREGDAAPQPVPKKVVKVQSSKPLALQNAERRKALEALKAGGKPVTTAANPAAPAKAKVAVAPPPKSAVFSTLMSASKRPGTSLAARAAAASKEQAATAITPPVSAMSIKKESVRKESPPRSITPVPKTASATSSLLGLLADMEKKPEKETKKVTEIPNETEEEKAVRLRKEARRKLRVSWKADSELVETRLFTHDPDEEIGDGDSLKRDAGDTGREGEALKLHKTMEELEDDEDEDSFEELEPYTPPSDVDFSVLQNESGSFEVNSFKFGGAMKPESASCETQNKREQETVMTTYTSKADRPPTPKEPDENEDGDFEPAEPAADFGEPNEKIRQREKEYLARQVRSQPVMPTNFGLQPQTMSSTQAPHQQAAAIPIELQRALASLSGQPQQSAQSAPQVDFSAILQSVQQISQQVQGQSQPPPYPVPSQVPAATPDLSAILANLQQQSSQAQNAAPLAVGMGNNPNPYPGSLDDSSRKHGRTDSNDYDETGRKGGSKKKKPYNYKTQVCSFWEQGRCTKGESCTYRHGEEDLT